MLVPTNLLTYIIMPHNRVDLRIFTHIGFKHAHKGLKDHGLYLYFQGCSCAKFTLNPVSQRLPRNPPVDILGSVSRLKSSLAKKSEKSSQQNASD